eukprot:5771801-Amphidinium_carterae.1
MGPKGRVKTMDTLVCTMHCTVGYTLCTMTGHTIAVLLKYHNAQKGAKQFRDSSPRRFFRVVYGRFGATYGG